jgi:hypothetical protein
MFGPPLARHDPAATVRRGDANGIGRAPAASWSAQDFASAGRLQKSAAARTARPSRRATAAGAPSGEAVASAEATSCLLSLNAAALRKRPWLRLHDRVPRSNGQRTRRRAAAPAHLESLAATVATIALSSHGLASRDRIGDRALVPRPIRSIATPHGWIVANAIVSGRTRQTTKAIARVRRAFRASLGAWLCPCLAGEAGRAKRPIGRRRRPALARKQARRPNPLPCPTLVDSEMREFGETQGRAGSRAKSRAAGSGGAPPVARSSRDRSPVKAQPARFLRAALTAGARFARAKRGSSRAVLANGGRGLWTAPTAAAVSARGRLVS